MAPNITRLLLAMGALSVALLAIFLESSCQFLLEKSVAYGIPLLPKLAINPAVMDVARNIRYIGSYSADIEHFHNIFYAQDTSGENRSAPPVQLLPSKGSVIDATQPGAWCPQATGDIFPFTSKVVNLYGYMEVNYNIPYPRAENDRCINDIHHPGGHALGSGSDTLYQPDGVIRQAKADGNPLIFVSINYRLGFFGFATNKALLKARHTNAGLRDQRAALEWVRDNIEIFGGDPRRVTVMGQSVGGSDISLHLTSFGGTRGVPFQQAI